MDDRDRSMMSVIGVYLPCLEQGVDSYREHLVELERIVCELRLLGSVPILGDFNAHLGGENCPGDQNLQGVLLQAVLERCELSTVSQGALASGPVYTYSSGEVRTTMDYILLDVNAASMMNSCRTHPMDDFEHLGSSTSDSVSVI